MNIGILTSANPQLRVQLETKAAPDATTQAADSEIAEVAAPKPRPVVNVAPSVKFPSLRAALDARIAADVSSGALSQRDAATVGSVLDAIDNRSYQGSTAAFLANRAGYADPAADATPTQTAQNYLATIGRGTLIDRYA